MKAWRMLCLFLALAVLGTLLVPAAACADGPRFHVYIEEDGEEKGFGYAFAVNVAGEKHLLAANYTDDDTVYIKSGDERYNIEEEWDYLTCGFYRSGLDYDAALEAVCPHRGDTVNIRYTIKESDQIYTCQTKARLGDVVFSRNGRAEVELELAEALGGTVSLTLFPALGYLSDSEVAGAMVTHSGRYYLYIPWFDANTYTTAGAAKETEPAGTPTPTPTPPGEEPTPTPSASAKPGIGLRPADGVSDGDDGTVEPGKRDWRMTVVIGLGCAAGLAIVVAVAAVLMQKKRKAQPGKKPGGDAPFFPDDGKDITIRTTPLPDGTETQGLFIMGRGGYQEGRIYPINGTVKIGRLDTNNIVYPADYPGVSREHLRLDLSNGALYMMDNSANGTYLQRAGESSINRVPRGQAIRLQPGDTFFLAERKNEFRVILRQGPES